MKKTIYTCLVLLIVVTLQVIGQPIENIFNNTLPQIPVGLDSYRMWDKWPQQRLGVRAYMRSTYDRTGGNEGADASHYLFANEETYNVSLDIKGKGVLYFFRTNHWHGSPWHFVADGTDNIVKETGTSDPVNAKKTFKNPEFIPYSSFPKPLNFTWATTKGADLIWTPMPFEESFRIAYSRTRYGTGYYIYHLYANEENFSQPIKSWELSQKPASDVISLLEKAGTDVAPQKIKTKSGSVKLDKQEIEITNIEAHETSAIRAIKFSLPIEKALDLERIRLVATWDGAQYPSINAPLCLFYGAGTFYNRDEKEFLVKAFPVNIRYDYPNNTVELGCYFPMPFYKSASIGLKEIEPGDAEIKYEIRYEKLNPEQNLNSYFHATYKDFPYPTPGIDMVFLDTRGAEGHNEWSGSFVGTSFIFSHRGVLNTLEGDPRFLIDDCQTPNYGTGTEEWGGGGDYWGGRTMTLPFAGHPVGCPWSRNMDKVKHPKDSIQSAYRFLLADLMPFGKRIQVQFEHGAENLSTEHYEAVTYWYGVPSPALVLTDELNIGDYTSEVRHSYISKDASKTETISSRYEWGIDHFPTHIWGRTTIPPKKYECLKGEEIFAPHSEIGRHTRGSSEFKMKLDPDNVGVLLRRTLDYSFPNQTAEVFIADASNGKKLEQASWVKAGIWYTAGSNTLIYSNPKGELDKRNIQVQISNRRFRDDEFLIPAKLTSNKSAIWIKVKFIPNNQELFPGTPFPKESAWSELRYKAYSYKIPDFFNNIK